MPGPTQPLPGSTDIREKLAALVAADRLHSCLLFEGPGGVGKAQVARWVAGLMACEAPRGRQSCGSCWSCRRVEEGSHPDVIHVGLDPERKAPIISAEQARSILEVVSVQPSWARRRTVILDPADALHPSAANALLKT
ncbi:MAG: DNA polymerase III subunit delta', partial [Myxococcota bacterium]|nr:DNA polymerase III subunit delta' [Myxococcota bacterium]